jgi:hypothetical protein
MVLKTGPACGKPQAVEKFGIGPKKTQEIFLCVYPVPVDIFKLVVYNNS